MKVSSAVLGSIVRFSLILGGLMLIALSWPVARSALIFQKTDAFFTNAGAGKPYTLAEFQSAQATVDAAVAAYPLALRHQQRAELLAIGATTPTLKASDEQRRAWMRQAKADAEAGLRNDPARASDWLRLVIINEWIDGPSRDIPPLLFMAIDTGRMSAPLWPTQVRVILDNWGYFSDDEKQQLASHVVMIWRKSPDRRFFGTSVYVPIDEIILRYILQGEPKAEQELTLLIADAEKWRRAAAKKN